MEIWKYKGHCINFAQDISGIARVLPKLPTEIGVVIIEKSNCHGQKTEDLRVRRHFVEAWLRYLKDHSEVPGYQNMEISEDNLASLPVDDIPDNLPTIIDDEIELAVPDRNQEDDEPFIDTDPNPAADTAVYFPPNNLATGLESIQKIIDGLRG